MEYIDLKLKKKKRDDSPEEVADENEDEYPYGLQLRFETEQIEKIDALKIGDMVKVYGIAKITDLSLHEKVGKEKARKDATLQLQKIVTVSSKRKGSRR